MYDVHIQKCLSAIYFKSNLDRGGCIEGVHVRDVRCDSARSAVIRFENNYHGSRGGAHPTTFQGFVIQRVTCTYSGEVGIYAVGVKDHPLKDIQIKAVTVLHTPKDQIVDNVVNLTYAQVFINGSRLIKPVITGSFPLHTD